VRHPVIAEDRAGEVSVRERDRVELELGRCTPRPGDLRRERIELERVAEQQRHLHRGLVGVDGEPAAAVAALERPADAAEAGNAAGRLQPEVLEAAAHAVAPLTPPPLTR